MSRSGSMVMKPKRTRSTFSSELGVGSGKCGEHRWAHGAAGGIAKGEHGGFAWGRNRERIARMIGEGLRRERVRRVDRGALEGSLARRRTAGEGEGSQPRRGGCSAH